MKGGEGGKRDGGHPGPKRYLVTVDERTVEVEIHHGGTGTDTDSGTGHDTGSVRATVRIGDRAVEAEIMRVGETPRYRLTLDGRSRRLVARRERRGEWRLLVGGDRRDVRVESERERDIAELARDARVERGPDPVRAPMPGLVVKIEVEAGQRVEAGDGLVVVEAMKMENELSASGAATVRRILVDEGESVEKGAVLIEFDAEDASDTGEKAT